VSFTPRVQIVLRKRAAAYDRAFDMEKRQHLFSAGVIQPLKPHQVGFYGMGSVSDVGVDIQGAEKEVEQKFSLDPSSAEKKKEL
jgi:hypothetical protein